VPGPDQTPPWALTPEPKRVSPPVGALSAVPKATLGAARPLIRYGEARPMIRYGAVKAADETEEPTNEEMSEGVPDETGLDTAWRKGRGAPFAHGTDPWRWAQGRLFARAPSRSVAPVETWQDPVELEPLESAPPRTADRSSEFISGQLPGDTIYRR
jgi:hypothetical protein